MRLPPVARNRPAASGRLPKTGSCWHNRRLIKNRASGSSIPHYAATRPDPHIRGWRRRTGYRQTSRNLMKKGIHPEYREVVFADLSGDFKFITRSTMGSRETTTIDGKEYPLVKLEVTSESHPFYTGKHKVIDTAGRIDKFRQKFGNRTGKAAA